MAVDVYSLVTRFIVEGADELKNTLRDIDAQGVKTAAALHQGTIAINSQTSAALNGKKGFKDLGDAQAYHAGVMSGQIPNTWRAKDALDRKTQSAGLLSAGLKQLAGWYAGFSLLSFTKEVLDAAGELHELSMRTGASVRMLSILQFAGAQAGVGTSEIAQGFRGLSMSLGQLRDGTPKAVEAFQRIGLHAQDLKGLSVDQVFQKVVEKLNLLPDGFEKAEAAQRIFGRGGAALLPLLDDLATKGFGKVAEEAEKMGAVIDAKAAARADAFGDALTRLKGSFGAFIREALMPALPALTSFLDFLALAAQKASEMPRLLRVFSVPGGLAMAGWEKMFGSDPADWNAGSPITETDPAAAGRLSSRSRNRFGPGIELMSDAEAKEFAREQARKAKEARETYVREVMGRANMDEAMRPASSLSFVGFPDTIATRDDRIDISGNLFAPDMGGDKAVDDFERTVEQASRNTNREFAMLGANLGMTLARGFGAGLSAALKGENPFKAMGKVVLAGLGSIMVSMGEALLSQGAIMMSLLPALSNPLTAGPAMLVAGALLVGLGTILGGIATGPGKGGGGGGGASRDRVTEITLTADGLGGRNAPHRPDEKFTVLGVDSPKGQRVLATAMAGAKRRGM